MSKWTSGMNRILYDHGHMGVRKVRRMIKARYGVEFTIPAVQMHASRIGASLREVGTCARCGHQGPPDDFIRGTSMCRKCRYEYLAEKTRLGKLGGLDEREVGRARREYDTARQDKHRKTV